MPQKFLVLGTCFLMVACQKSSHEPPPVLKPTVSHGTVKEKQVIIPAEVAREWRAVRISVIDKVHATENVYSFPIGKVTRVPGAKLSLSVDAFLPSFVIEGSTITSSSNKPGNPGVKVRITDSDTGLLVYAGWLFVNFPNTHAVTHPNYAFNFVAPVAVSR
ncbi:MAG TPA: DUF2155 domain-containing protein [Desulfuromonadales bacterium]|nr:DUF2155 domain-containing protein [Desulfuromonadales bacterium]